MKGIVVQQGPGITPASHAQRAADASSNGEMPATVNHSLNKSRFNSLTVVRVQPSLIRKRSGIRPGRICRSGMDFSDEVSPVFV
jgi:hypothetical protein